jgi:hypothetical protein
MQIKLLFDRREGKAGDIIEIGKDITRYEADKLIRVNNAIEVEKNVSDGKPIRRNKRVRGNNGA